MLCVLAAALLAAVQGAPVTVTPLGSPPPPAPKKAAGSHHVCRCDSVLARVTTLQHVSSRGRHRHSIVLLPVQKLAVIGMHPSVCASTRGPAAYGNRARIDVLPSKNVLWALSAGVSPSPSPSPSPVLPLGAIPLMLLNADIYVIHGAAHVAGSLTELNGRTRRCHKASSTTAPGTVQARCSRCSCRSPRPAPASTQPGQPTTRR